MLNPPPPSVAPGVRLHRSACACGVWNAVWKRQHALGGLPVWTSCSLTSVINTIRVFLSFEFVSNVATPFSISVSCHSQ